MTPAREDVIHRIQKIAQSDLGTEVGFCKDASKIQRVQLEEIQNEQKRMRLMDASKESSTNVVTATDKLEANARNNKKIPVQSQISAETNKAKTSSSSEISLKPIQKPDELNKEKEKEKVSANKSIKSYGDKFIRPSDQKEKANIISVKPLNQLQSFSDTTTKLASKQARELPTSSTTSTSSIVPKNSTDISTKTKSSTETPHDLQQKLLKIFTERNMQNKNKSSHDRINSSPGRLAARSKSLCLDSKIIRRKKMRPKLDISTNNVKKELKNGSMTSLSNDKSNKMSSSVNQSQDLSIEDFCMELDQITKNQSSSLSSTLKPIPTDARKIKQRSTTEVIPSIKIEKETTNDKQSNSLSLPFLCDLNRIITWNRQNRTGILTNSIVSFERNEFGMIELHSDQNRPQKRCESPKIRGKKRKKVDTTKLPCNHINFDACFNSLVVNFGNEFWINQTTPIEYYSNEFKDIVKACIKKYDQKCNLITISDIQKALSATKLCTKVGAVNCTTFNWEAYLNQWNDKNEMKLTPAPTNYFFNPFPKYENPFLIGQKLEAIDPLNCSSFCVCTVVDVRGFRIKLHFDGYHHCYDFWVNADSPEIFPVGWCEKTARNLQPPFSYVGKLTFRWNEYLSATKSTPAPRSSFPQVNAMVKSC